MKTIKIFRPLLGLLAVCLTMAACTPDETFKDKFNAFDRKAMLNSLGTNMIVPTYQELSNKADELANVAASFDAAPTNENLLQLQQLWIATAKAWKKAELYNIGPALEQDLMERVNAHPLDKQNLEANISNATTINQSYIESRSVYSKGFYALEYLLFDRTGSTDALMAKFTTEPNAAKRRQYVTELARNLQTRAKNVLTAWQPQSGNYLQTFANADGNDVNSSISLLTNRMVAFLESVRNKKIAEPAGIKTPAQGGGYGTPLPDNVEALESGQSLEFIALNMEALANTFTNRDRSGFDDLLNHLGAKDNNNALLSEKIKNQFSVVNGKIRAIDLPLNLAVEQRPEQVRDLYNSVQVLLILMKADMVNNIGVMITYNDNDGD